MKESKPFIHLFKTPSGYYIFDVNTNSIIKTKKEVYGALEKIMRDKPLDTIKDETLEIINSLKEKKYLSSNKVKELEHPLTQYVESRIYNKMKKITLQLTQNCNLRCSYCIYADNKSINDKQRVHSNKKMSFDIAKKAIDLLINNSRDEQVINVGFYGGEPVLEFDLIKKCVLYAEEIAEGKDIEFSITTNGTLFNTEVIEFFMKHDILCLISFDGPKEIHNRHRKFANGEGSFETIEKNLLFIKKNYPEYMDKISFNVVINPQDDYKCINEFFVDYGYFKETNVRSSLIDDLFLDEKTQITEQYAINSNYEIFKMFLSYFKKIDPKHISPIAIQELESLKRFETNLDRREKLVDKTAPSGPCVPGQIRLFINADGNFYPCERVSEVSKMMKIGNIDEGFNIDQIKKLINISQLTSKQCKNCWAITHCFLCCKHADNGTELLGELKNKHCDIVKRVTDRMLKMYVQLAEIKKQYKVNI
ncbi:Cys-rich peptide radical SAM maturase CcpM [Clostridiaceae bacterium M8S5]|nr:Cys-rich peptide radical SAM maturase CcpM [Clostridiaceae bacterium M8S5]